MKKLFSALLAVVCLTVFLALPASAQPTPQILFLPLLRLLSAMPAAKRPWSTGPRPKPRGTLRNTSVASTTALVQRCRAKLLRHRHLRLQQLRPQLHRGDPAHSDGAPGTDYSGLYAPVICHTRGLSSYRRALRSV